MKSKSLLMKMIFLQSIDFGVLDEYSCSVKILIKLPLSSWDSLKRPDKILLVKAIIGFLALFFA